MNDNIVVYRCCTWYILPIVIIEINNSLNLHCIHEIFIAVSLIDVGHIKRINYSGSCDVYL